MSEVMNAPPIDVVPKVEAKPQVSSESLAPPVQDRLGLLPVFTDKAPFTHSQLVEKITLLSQNPVSRDSLLVLIDEQTKRESMNLKNQQPLSSDVFIIGTGPHATAFALQLKASAPHASVLMSEKSDTRGGQFRDITMPYTLNSPNIAMKRFALPFEKGEPNDIGDHAIVQSKDFSKTPFPTNAEFAAANVINSYNVAPALVRTQVLRIEKNLENGKGKYLVTSIDLDTKKEFVVTTDIVIGATGLGKETYGIDITIPENAKTISENKDQVFTFPEFMNTLHTENPRHLKKRLAQGIAIVGGNGDSAKVTLETLLDRIKHKKLSTGALDLYGADFDSAKAFLEKTSDRYKSIAPYIDAQNNSFSFSRLFAFLQKKVRINPHKEKVTTLTKHDTKIQLQLDNGKNADKEYGTVVFATGYKNDVHELMTPFLKEQESFVELSDPIQRVVIGKQVPGEAIYLVGPSAQIPYSEHEALHIPKEHQKRYENSLSRLIPRTEKVAEHIIFMRNQPVAKAA